MFSLNINRRVVLLAGALTLLCGGAYATTQGSTAWSKTYRVSGKPELRVEVDDGRIEVRGGNAGTIEAHLSLEGYRYGAGGVQVIEHESSGTVDIAVRVPRDQSWLNLRNRHLHLELNVPNGLNATLHTHDGAVIIENVNGTIRVRTGDGHIEATRVDGALDAETGDGSIRVRGQLQNLRLRTGDGSVEADVAPGSRVASPWEIQTGDGHVTLTLPSDFSADLDARTNDGGVHSDLPLTARSSGSNELRGRIGNGGGSVRVRTGDGSIKLLRR